MCATLFVVTTVPFSVLLIFFSLYLNSVFRFLHVPFAFTLSSSHLFFYNIYLFILAAPGLS